MSAYKLINESIFERNRLISKLDEVEEWDLVVIGGGASGLGAALDAISRGMQVLLVEKEDFAKGTSSKSTKLVHGGVRYLAQGDIDLVKEALHERGLLLKNARHLVKNQSFVVPGYNWWDIPFYGIGLKMYDWLSGKLSLGGSEVISKANAVNRIPTLKGNGLKGGILYHDGQFDDSRLALNLAQTCIEQGGTVLNHVTVVGLEKDMNGKLNAVSLTDQETQKSYVVKTKAVVNATGVFVNEILKMDTGKDEPLVRPSQGAHIVLDRSFLPSTDAIMIPKTSDGRVLFAIPWHNRIIVGTTDIPVQEETLDPIPLEEEIQFILDTAAQYLTKAPNRSDVLAVFAGLRPLAASKGNSNKTKEISRSHKVLVEPSGLVTITGGKWTTYRKMGQDTIDKVLQLISMTAKPSNTENMLIHGADIQHESDWLNHRYVYGSDISTLHKLESSLPDGKSLLHKNHNFTVAEVVFAIRYEMARTVEDILARRVRLLFLDSKAAVEVAPKVIRILASELGWDDTKQQKELTAFLQVATGYILP